jgi:acyl carrier protein
LYHDFCPIGNREIVSLMSVRTVRARIRAVLKGTDTLHVDIDTLADDADLYTAGLSSHATVNLMLALEEAFDIEFPDRLLRRRTFSSVEAMAEALAELGVKEAA